MMLAEAAPPEFSVSFNYAPFRFAYAPCRCAIRITSAMFSLRLRHAACRLRVSLMPIDAAATLTLCRQPSELPDCFHYFLPD